MLTVIVSVRSSGVVWSSGMCVPSVRALDDLADRMEERHVHLLHPAGRLVRHVDVNLRHRAERAAVAAGQRHGAQPARRSLPAPPRSRSASCRWSKSRPRRRRPARAPRSAARTSARTRSRSRRSSARRCRWSAQSPPSRADRARTARPARRRSAAHRRRCRRCRTPAPCRRRDTPPRSTSAALATASSDFRPHLAGAARPHRRARARSRAARSASGRSVDHRHHLLRDRLLAASTLATNSSADSCSGSYVLTGILICTG